MKWSHLVTVSKEMVGLSGSWDINVAWINDGNFAWQTADDDPDENDDDDPDENDDDDSDENDDDPIDTGSAELIADYIVENAYGFESDLLEGLKKLAERKSCFLPLLDAVNTQIGE
ncbi:hypothetical protein OAG92_05535 [Akkermansiaceae bacterium]|nr:hypothetical protein [Akkermansiaceae bacterium]MDB4801691.1 hypothetical protein [Akkermansiaceae bacterium]